jgi:hypothetical protein
MLTSRRCGTRRYPRGWCSFRLGRDGEAASGIIGVEALLSLYADLSTEYGDDAIDYMGAM